MTPRHLDRRAVLTGMGAATLLPPSVAVAVPAHAFTLGDIEITILSDGHLTVPTRFLARHTTEAEIKTHLGIATDFVTPPCNVTLVRTPTETILIDVGAGPHFMPGAGKLADNMDATGVDRRSPPGGLPLTLDFIGQLLESFRRSAELSMAKRRRMMPRALCRRVHR